MEATNKSTTGRQPRGSTRSSLRTEEAGTGSLVAETMSVFPSSTSSSEANSTGRSTSESNVSSAGPTELAAADPIQRRRLPTPRSAYNGFHIPGSSSLSHIGIAPPQPPSPSFSNFEEATFTAVSANRLCASKRAVKQAYMLHTPPRRKRIMRYRT